MLALATFPAATSPAATAVVPLTRYSLVHGCYVLRTASGQLGPFTMQAAALGQYLLYGVHGDFLDPSLSQSTAPTIWTVAPDVHSISASGSTVAVTFIPSTGCAPYPEAQVDATGTPFTGSSSMGTVQGTIDAHTHVTAFEFLGGSFHCGKPWDPLGVRVALPDCKPYEQGVNGQVESFLDYGAPGATPNDMVGWPTFVNWPGPTKLSEEGDYYTGIKRAWMAGLRVMVTQLVDNEQLCGLMTTRTNPCNDMQAVDLQAHDLRMLQDYIDAQSGGPGTGFFRIVTDPFQARQVINEGKLAVVEGIEVSHLFDCGNVGQAACAPAQIDTGLTHVRSVGVSTFFPVHKFDNAFGGAKMDGGDTGVLINLANHLTTGHFFDVKTCTRPEHDNTQITEPTTGMLASMLIGPLAPLTGGGLIPLYPAPPHCNQQGLTAIGAYLINQMIKRHFIVELDHMDAKTADAALQIIEAHNYSGVISAHSWDSPQENAGIYNVGGFVTPIAGASPTSFIDQWKATQPIRDKRFYAGSGFGYGADMNGLAEESQPTAAHPISYPFTSLDGKVTFTREVWGNRTFDLNKDGVANYGMFADWLQELQMLAGSSITADMFRGAEAYLEMWERAYGVAPTRCLPAGGRFGAAGLGGVRLGASFQSLLYAAGQPASRPGRSYRYCVARGGNVSAVFGARGSVVAIVSTARGVRAGALEVGARVRALARVARSVGGGLWLGRRLRGGSRLIYGVRGGRVSYAGVV
jgi:hypothetical protein